MAMCCVGFFVSSQQKTNEDETHRWCYETWRRHYETLRYENED